MPSPLKTAIPLSLQERIKTGCSHLQPITFSDLVDTAGTSKTITSVVTGKARQGIGRIFFVVKQTFDGGATSDLTVKPVLNYASSTDKDLALAVSIHEDAIEILGFPGQIADVITGTIDATWDATESGIMTDIRTKLNQVLGRLGIVANETWALDLVFTSTGANLTALTQGKLQVFVELIDLSDFEQVV